MWPWRESHRRLSRIGGALRWQEWYASKVPFVWTALALAALNSPRPAREILEESLGVIAFVCLCGAFGHLANDFADRASDHLVGKFRAASRLSPTVEKAMLVLLPAMSLVVLAALGLSLPAAAAGLATIGLAATYSMEPLRFKRRGALGLWAAAAAQRTLPCVFAFAVVGRLNGVAWAVAAVAQFAGLRWMMAHQISDADNDRLAGIETYACVVGVERARSVLQRMVFPTELVALAVALALAALENCAIWAIAATGAILVAGRIALATSLDAAYSLEGFALQPLAGFYQIVWPLGCVLVLASSRVELWPLAAAFVLWEAPYIAHQVGRIARLLAASLS